MMKIWKLYILFIYIYIYTITQIFVKRFFEFPYRLSRLTVHRAYIYMKNPIPSIKSFIYLYRDYSKISNDNISKFLSKSTSPPPTAQVSQIIRDSNSGSDPLDSRPLCFRFIANSRIPRPQNERACFSGAGCPLDR